MCHACDVCVSSVLCRLSDAEAQQRFWVLDDKGSLVRGCAAVQLARCAGCDVQLAYVMRLWMHRHNMDACTSLVMRTCVLGTWTHRLHCDSTRVDPR